MKRFFFNLLKDFFLLHRNFIIISCPHTFGLLLGPLLLHNLLRPWFLRYQVLGLASHSCCFEVSDNILILAWEPVAFQVSILLCSLSCCSSFSFFLCFLKGANLGLLQRGLIIPSMELSKLFWEIITFILEHVRV